MNSPTELTTTVDRIIDDRYFLQLEIRVTSRHHARYSNLGSWIDPPLELHVQKARAAGAGRWGKAKGGLVKIGLAIVVSSCWFMVNWWSIRWFKMVTIGYLNFLEFS